MRTRLLVLGILRQKLALRWLAASDMARIFRLNRLH
jgi:hypothetical protein